MGDVGENDPEHGSSQVLGVLGFCITLPFQQASRPDQDNTHALATVGSLHNDHEPKYRRTLVF